MERLRGVVQHYAWGSLDALPALLGVPPDGRPWAELWFGAHPLAPAAVERDGRWQPLDAVIAADPVGELGVAVCSRFGPRLPFLLKLLAAAEPLSLQAHPSAEQARDGYSREEALGVPLTAPDRIYRDDWAKPELLCALEPFDALCGFRPVARTLELLDALDCAVLRPWADGLRRDPSAAGLRYLVGALLTLGPGEQAMLVEETLAASDELAGWPLVRAATLTLGTHYPSDIGVVVALLLNCVRLAPGEAVFLGPGNLHAYLRGTGVEVMAASDNVLRGGLTPKHVDVAELLRTLDTRPLAEPVVHATEGRFAAPTPEFSLRVAEGPAELAGPAIAWCHWGRFDGLAAGEAAWLRAGSHAVLRGDGRLFVASIGSDTAG